nr:zinc finger, CCHC-type [Tanacetum cinerariifolium]
MTEKDAFLVDYVEGGLRVDNTDAGIVGRTVDAIRIREKWENDDYMCRGHILNGISDSLFDVYTNVESAKELWDSLESKYMTEDSSKKSLREQDRDKRKGKEVGGPSVNMIEEKVVIRRTQMLVVREKGLRTIPKTKVDAIAWWIDSGATTHVCKDRFRFKTYEPMEDGSVLYMGVSLKNKNSLDWYRQLRIVLSIEDKLNYLEQPILPTPIAPEGQQVALEILAAHAAWVKGSKEIAGLMLMSMEPEIQRNLEPLHAHEMLKELKTLFAQQAEHKLLQTTRDFHSCRQEEGQSVSSYVLKMKGYIDNLECLGHPVTLGLDNYNMHSMGKTVNELHAMLKLHEQTLNLPKSSAPALHDIQAGKVQKSNKHKKSHSQKSAKGKNQGKGKFASKPKNKILVARYAEFLDNSLINQKASGSLEDLEIIQEEDTHPSIDTSLNHVEDDLEIDESQSDIVPIRRSTRTRHAPDRMCLYIDAGEHALGDLGEPANYKAALSDPESEKWLNAMNVEMQSMKDNEVWVLVELPPNGKTGNTQTPWIDYEETFSPVTDIRAIWIIIAIAAYYDYEIWQMDVKTAFLNGYFNEEVKLHIFLESRSTDIDHGGASTPAELKRMQNVPYASVVSFIMYDVRFTCPDVAFAQNVTSRFQQNLGDLHWTTVKNILKYLRNTKDMFLAYEGNLKRELRVSFYTNAGYLTDADDLKSQTGYVFVLNGGTVDWKSAKQSIFTTSSAEAEYIAAFDASKEAV